MLTVLDADAIIVKPFKDKIGIFDYESGDLNYSIDSIDEFKMYMNSIF